METDVTAVVPQMQVRLFDESDHDMVNDWRRSRGYPAVPEHVLPKLGVIVEAVEGGEVTPLASAHLYMDNSVGVCWPEWLTTRPAMPVGRSREALRLALQFLEARVEGDYSIMVARCYDILAAECEKLGYKRLTDGQVVLAKTVSG